MASQELKFSTMKKYLVLYSLLIISIFFMAAHSPELNDPGIQGEWVRKSDNLRINIVLEKDNQLTSFIIAEGDKKFPCNVSGLPIYKTITKTKENHWTCDFLVVTIGVCSTDYEEGEIRVTKSGDLEVICPGFSKKIYKRVKKPRYNSSDKKFPI